MANIVIEDIKRKFKSDNPVTRLIVINIVVFIIISVFRILMLADFAPIKVLTHLVLENLSFTISIQGLIYKPWTIITYAFTHVEVFHILWNMLILFWFGQILLDYTSSKKIIPVYLLGAIAGALFSMLMVIIIPNLNQYVGIPMIGASAGVTAIVIAAATLLPHFKMNLMFIGEIKLVYVALFYVLIDILNVASYSNVGGNLAHLGGALMGYLFIVQMKKGNDLAKPINIFFDWISGLFSIKPKMRVVSNNKKFTDEEFNQNRVATQKQIDAILDKISKSGYDSLSKTEKEILFKASKK